MKKNGNVFEYIYQYKDHLGNVRLSYADSNDDGSITASTEIVEESNYYPFGLKHKGYNNVISSNGNSVAQKWGYQGQELSEDLGYNMQEYRFRHYDAATGRFFAIDPLASDFVYNSTYAFQENKLGMGVELEGLELATGMNMMYAHKEDVYNETVNLDKMSGFGTTIGIVGSLDVMFNGGQLTKEIISQVAIGSTFNLADQMLTGKEIDPLKAVGDATINVDYFDAGMSVFVEKVPGGKLVNQLVEHLAPSMIDLTSEGGLQIGGYNKDMSDVAIDFGFSAASDKFKVDVIPKMKFSGNTLVRNVKEAAVDVISSLGSDAAKDTSLPSTSNRTYTNSRLNTERARDNTRVRQPIIKNIDGN